MGPTVSGLRTIGRAATSTPSRVTAPAITQSGTFNSDDITNATADLHAMKPYTTCMRRCRSPMSSGSGTEIVQSPSGHMMRKRGTTSSRESTIATETCNSSRILSFMHSQPAASRLPFDKCKKLHLLMPLPEGILNWAPFVLS